MAAVTIYMSGDDSRLQAMHSRLLADQQKVLDKYSKMAGASKAASEEEARALAIKKRIADQEKQHQKLVEKGLQLIKDMRTPQEAFNDSIREAIKLKDKGVISTETLTRRYKQLKEQLRDATGETKRLKEAEAQEDREKAKAIELTARYSTKVEKLAASLKEVKRLYDDGKVSLETYQRAQKELDDATDPTVLDGWVTKLSALAASYVSVNTAIQVVTESMREQMDLQKASLDENTKLGMAQAEAVKNFAGLDEPQMKRALEIPKQMAEEMHFQSAAALTEAMGATYSVVGDIQKDEGAVRAAAEITRLDPSKTSDTSVGILKVGEAAQVEAKKASGFLLSVGKESAIKDSTKITQAVTPVVQTATALYPNQNREEVASQAAAIWATLVDKAGDERGDASSTAAITLMSKMNEFFQGLNDPKNADNERREKEIAKLEKSAVVTEKEAQGIKVAEANVEKATKAFERSQPGSKDFEKLKLAKETAEVNLRDLQRRSTLTPEEAKRLESLKAEKSTLGSIKDPGTLEGQLKILQQNTSLREMLFENPFGEQKFKAPMEQLATAQTDTASMFATKAPAIRFDANLHDQSAQMQLNVTEELALAQSQARARADEATARLNRKDYGATDAIIATRTNALRENRNASIPNYISEKVGYMSFLPAYASGDPVRAAKAAKQEIRDRQELFLKRDDDGFTKNDRDSAENLNKALQNLAITVESVMTSLTQAQQKQAKQVIENIRTESTNAAARIQAAKVNN